MKELEESTLTWPAAAARVEKLEENGDIEGSSIKVNQANRVLHVYLHQYLYLWQKQFLYMFLHRPKIGYLDFYQMSIFISNNKIND
jgi:Lrp/AsnC family transcriptional regulator, leucine-responsive regulatory protein